MNERLKAEYIVIEEAARLVKEMESVLPESRRHALFVLSQNASKDLPEDEFRRAARAAMIRELLEFLETELNPPQRPPLRLIRN